MVPTNQKVYDECVAIVKARVKRWPSAYASGQVVVEYKRAMAALGKPAYAEPDAKPKSKPRNAQEVRRTPLGRWFAEKWTDIRTGKPCGASTALPGYPTCRPAVRVSSGTPVTMGELSQKQKASMIAQKQKAGPKTVHYKETKAVRERI
jgi:hypothetical protein